MASLVATTVVTSSRSVVVEPRRRHARLVLLPNCVREWPLHYEDNGTERHALGSVAVGANAWWSAALTIPARDDPSDAAFIRFERHGERPASYLGDVVEEVSVPRSELDAIVLLLAGVVDQARRDGLLTSLRS